MFYCDVTEYVDRVAIISGSTYVKSNKHTIVFYDSTIQEYHYVCSNEKKVLQDCLVILKRMIIKLGSGTIDCMQFNIEISSLNDCGKLVNYKTSFATTTKRILINLMSLVPYFYNQGKIKNISALSHEVDLVYLKHYLIMFRK